MNQNVDKRLLTYIANEVANHKFAKLIESIKKLDYSTNKCSYCKMPTDKRSCYKCEKVYCGREYYCEKPKDNKGFYNIEDPCLRHSNICSACYSKCHIANCNKVGCASDYNCSIKICYTCKLPTCFLHAPLDPINYNTHEKCIDCIKIDN